MCCFYFIYRVIHFLNGGFTTIAGMRKRGEGKSFLTAESSSSTSNNTERGKIDLIFYRRRSESRGGSDISRGESSPACGGGRAASGEEYGGNFRGAKQNYRS